MRKVTIALVSFALGAIFAVLLGNGRSALVSQVSAQQLPRSPYIPLVPPPPRTFAEGNVFDNQAIIVDGTYSRFSKYINPTFEYGGGAFYMKGVEIDGNVNIELIGAAANTAGFLKMFGLYGCTVVAPPTPPVIDMDKPMTKTVKLTKPLSGDLKAPFGISQ
jgi:hypothetical protein